MARVMAHLREPLDDLRHPRQRPEIGTEPAARGPARKARSTFATCGAASLGLRPARPAALRAARPCAFHA